MSAPLRIAAADRELWQSIAAAAFANPFSPQRREFDLKFIGKNTNRTAAMVAMISQSVEKLEKANAANFLRYTAEDAEMMRTVFLFEIYHKFCERFDELIANQITAGERSIAVPFANQAFGLFVKRGFSQIEGVRFFAIFYQLRRAHFFICNGLLGQAPCMLELRRHLWNNVFTCDIRAYDNFLWNRMEDFSTLLLGETGTGKGAAAAAIGRSGFIPFDERRGAFAESFLRSFSSLNLSQFSQTLIESELFGHRKGAFTGAIEAHQGVFARCSPHGAIFLDEIGDVSVPIQIKLLQILQDRTFSPVGSREQLRFHGRVIAATNKSINELRREKLFRDDFFYRLCSDLISIPTLCQRLQEYPAELDLLVNHILHRMTGRPAPELTASILKVLTQSVGYDYSWPGNVRELEQAIRRILLTDRYDGEKRNEDPSREFSTQVESGSLDADGLLSRYCQLLYRRHNTYEEVAKLTKLDPRTVKKYLEQSRWPDLSGAIRPSLPVQK